MLSAHSSLVEPRSINFNRRLTNLLLDTAIGRRVTWPTTCHGNNAELMDHLTEPDLVQLNLKQVPELKNPWNYGMQYDMGGNVKPNSKLTHNGGTVTDRG